MKPHNPFLDIYTREMKAYFQTVTCTQILISDFIHSYRQLQGNLNSSVDKQGMLYAYNGILLRNKRERG